MPEKKSRGKSSPNSTTKKKSNESQEEKVQSNLQPRAEEEPNKQGNLQETQKGASNEQGDASTERQPSDAGGQGLDPSNFEEEIKVDAPNELGDKVKVVLEKTGIAAIVKFFSGDKDCGCEARKELLNKASRKANARPIQKCITQEQFEFLEEHVPKIISTTTAKVMTELTKIHAAAYSYRWDGYCSTCPSQNRIILNELKFVMNEFRKQIETLEQDVS